MLEMRGARSWSVQGASAAVPRHLYPSSVTAIPGLAQCRMCSGQLRAMRLLALRLSRLRIKHSRRGAQ